MNKLIRELSKLREEHRVSQYGIEVLMQDIKVSKERGFEVDLPCGYILWLTRIQAENDDVIDKVKLLGYGGICHFVDNWAGIKATAHTYIGETEPSGFATIVWLHYFGTDGIDLRREMPGRLKLEIIPKVDRELKLTLQHTLFKTVIM